jgi:hypothetical protein
MSKRVQTKDLYQRVGRPEFTPQAKASTFAYVAPQSSSQGNTLEQLGAAGLVAADAVAKWGARGMQKEESEGLKEGKRLALIAFRQNGMKAFRAAEINGDIENADNPFVKKFYLNTMGQLAANSEAFMNHLTEDVDGWIDDQVLSDIGGEGFDELMHEFILGRVDGFMEGMPNSRFMRDEGFSEAAVPVVERVKQYFRGEYKKKISAQNVEGIKETIQQGIVWGRLTDSGEYSPKSNLQDTFDWYNGFGRKESEDFPEHGRLDKSMEGIAPRSTLPATGPNSNQRMFWAQEVFNHINGSIVEAPNSLKYAESLRNGLRFLTRAENLTERNTGAKARSGSMSVAYDTLRINLEKKLAQAAQGEQARAAAAEGDLDDYISSIAVAGQMRTPKNTLKFDQAGVPTGTDLEYTKTIEDFGGRVMDFMEYLKSGEYAVGDEKVIWGARDEEFLEDGVTPNPAFGNPLSPTRAMMDALDDRAALQFLQDDIAKINTQIANRIANQDKLTKRGEEAWANGILRLKKGARFHFKGGEKWNDEVLNNYVNNNMAELTKISTEWNIHGGGAPVLDNLTNFMKNNFGDSRAPTPRKGLVAGYAFIANPANTIRWANKPAIQRIAEFMRIHGHTQDDAKLLSDALTTHAAPILSLLKFDKGETGEVMINRIIKETLEDNNSTLMHSIQVQSRGVPKGALQFGGAMYATLHQETQDFMRAEYYPVIHKLSQIYNMNTKHATFNQSLEAALTQAGSGPVMIIHPTTGAQVQLLPFSLRHGFKLLGQQPNYYTRGTGPTAVKVRAPYMSPYGAMGGGLPGMAPHSGVIAPTVTGLGVMPAGATVYSRFNSWDGKLKAREQGR